MTWPAYMEAVVRQAAFANPTGQERDVTNGPVTLGVSTTASATTGPASASRAGTASTAPSVSGLGTGS